MSPRPREGVHHVATPRWRRRLATAREVGRAAGLPGIAFLVLQRAAPSPHVHPEWFAVLEHDTRTGPEPGGPLPRWGGPADIPLLEQGERDRATLQARFARGDRVAIVADEAGLIGYAWYRGGVYDEQGILFELDADEVWGYDAWIAEAHRRRGAGARLLRGSARALAQDGVTWVLLGIDHLNRPSLAAACAGGRVPIGSVWMLRILGVSARRESWNGRRPRWTLYRGARGCDRPRP